MEVVTALVMAAQFAVILLVLFIMVFAVRDQWLHAVRDEPDM